MPFPITTTNHAIAILKQLHVDLQGPFDKSIQDHVYTIGIINNYSWKGWKEYLKHKDEAPALIKALIQWLETSTGQCVKYIHSDHGSKFINSKLQTYLHEKGITHKMTALHTPQQNSMAEHFNQTTHESTLTMLKDAELSRDFWPEAHAYANYVHNCSPTKALNHSTPNGTLYGKISSVAMLHIFGSYCHVCVPSDQHQRLDAHSLDGTFCSLECQSKAYKIWIPSKYKFITSYNVIVYEKVPTHGNDELPPPITLTNRVPSMTVPAQFEGMSLDIDNLTSDTIIKSPLQPALPTPSHKPTMPSLVMPALPSKPQLHTPIPECKQDPVQPQLHQSEYVTCPSWKKEAVDRQREKDEKEKADCKAQWDAHKT